MKKDALRPLGAETTETPWAQAYQSNSGEISILMGSFFLRYLARVYKEFEGDLALVIVLGEIGHHNISHCYSGQGAACRVDRAKTSDGSLWGQLRPCNAFSLSAATGIPRETVRRKIEHLVTKGWLKRNDKGEVFITESVARHFHSDFDPRLLGEFLNVARRLQELLSPSTQEAQGLRKTPNSTERISPGSTLGG
jgi:hypothetical protein